MGFGETHKTSKAKRNVPGAAGMQLGITRQSVSKWESGSTLPELSKLIAISEIFGVSADYL